METDTRTPAAGTPSRGENEAPAPLPPYDAEGVDRSLIRELLGMSPAERLDRSDALAQDVEALRAALRGAGDGS